MALSYIQQFPFPSLSWKSYLCVEVVFAKFPLKYKSIYFFIVILLFSLYLHKLFLRFSNYTAFEIFPLSDFLIALVWLLNLIAYLYYYFLCIHFETAFRVVCFMAHTKALLRTYSWIYTLGSLLEGLRVSYEIVGIEFMSVTCKTSAYQLCSSPWNYFWILHSLS